jgi:hypothetical protein
MNRWTDELLNRSPEVPAMPHTDPLYATAKWRRLSHYVRFQRALGRCEHCGVPHGVIAAGGHSVIFLACAHLNGIRSDLRLENLRALCPQCHRLYDTLSALFLPRPARVARRRSSERRRTARLEDGARRGRRG